MDGLAAAVRDLCGDPDPRSVIQALNYYMFDELGFTGNVERYYSIDNNLLNRVLDTRTGMPVALSVVYLELGRRLGVQCHGVGLPGHFLVKLDELGLYLDPFNQGQLVSAADCRRMVRDSLGPHWSWRADYLSPYSKKDILFRILNNLKSIYLREKNYSQAIEVLKKMALISPSSPLTNRDLAWCHVNTLQQPTGRRHLQTYLHSSWPLSEVSEMQRQVESLWSAMIAVSRQSGWP
jgi:regulator of sirC expression with transglutaminase-like and TPR domain